MRFLTFAFLMYLFSSCWIVNVSCFLVWGSLLGYYWLFPQYRDWKLVYRFWGPKGGRITEKVNILSFFFLLCRAHWWIQVLDSFTWVLILHGSILHVSKVEVAILIHLLMSGSILGCFIWNGLDWKLQLKMGQSDRKSQ